MKRTIEISTYAGLGMPPTKATIPVTWRGKYLAVHRSSPRSAYQITHIPTGYMVWSYQKLSFKQVKAIAQHLDTNEFLNFTDPKCADLSALKKLIDETMPT